MKITEMDVIQSGERELIDAITGDLNWDVIEKIFRDKYNLGLQDDVEYRKGDIIVHKDQIAYKLDFEVKVNLSVLFNRKGDCLDVIASDEKDTTGDTDIGATDEIETDDETDESDGENVAEMAHQIADMISDINQE